MLTADQIREEMIRQLDANVLRPRDVSEALNNLPSPRVNEMRKRTRQVQDHEKEPLARLLGMTTPAPAITALTIEDIAAEHGFTFLEELDLALGMGATYLPGNADVVGLVPFKLDWLRGVHEGAMSHLKVVRGEGDSMEPTIHGGDIVLIDTATRKIDRQDGLWALAYGELGMIRRVRVRPDGTWVLMAEKDTVRDETVGDGEVAVIGRVIWSARQY